MIDTHDLQTALAWAWDEGHLAGAAGEPREANPYRDLLDQD